MSAVSLYPTCIAEPQKEISAQDTYKIIFPSGTKDLSVASVMYDKPEPRGDKSQKGSRTESPKKTCGVRNRNNGKGEQAQGHDDFNRVVERLSPQQVCPCNLPSKSRISILLLSDVRKETFSRWQRKWHFRQTDGDLYSG